MAENLSDPRPGDICWQRAQLSNDDGKSPEVLVALSDEFGALTKKEKMSRDFFNDQFYKDPKFPGLFFRQVIVEEVDKIEETVLFSRLDEKGQARGTPQTAKKEIFMATYFIPSRDG